jgi:two-component system chemotaxis sensor kinase CheA
MLIHAGTPVQLLALADVLGLPDRTMGETDRRPVIILSANGRQIGLVAESILAEREIVIQSLGARLAHCAYIGGATILPDGKVSLILSADDLVERGAAHSRPAMVGEAAGAAGGAGRRRLLIADDSATIRMLEKSILEAAGYDVVVATDGQDAWNLLLEMGADLVVSDVEMPRMDGFSLTEAIRGSARFRDLPVILVTGLESDADKARGMAVGANAYRPKSAFDQQDLLATIERML